VPTDDEWTILTSFLGGEDIAGGKMKSTGLQYWNSPNQDASNESGFSGLAGGVRYNFGLFDLSGFFGLWWSSTSLDGGGLAWFRSLSYSTDDVQRGNDSWELRLLDSLYKRLNAKNPNMKNLILLCFCWCPFVLVAQIQQNINKPSATVSNAIANIDSIRFNAASQEMQVVLVGGQTENHTLGDIDNITFSTNQSSLAHSAFIAMVIL